jgi:hypothetical protein
MHPALNFSRWTVFFFLFFLISLTHAQTYRGTLSGKVADPQGAAVAGAEVTLSNPQTGYFLRVRTNEIGEFIIPEVAAGTYDLSVHAEGFAIRTMRQIQVAVTKTTTVVVTLAIGSSSTVVNVSDSSVQTDPQSSALVSVIDNKAVQEMPMNGRDFTQMVKFVPGAVTSNLAVSVNGMRTSSVNFQLDGADNVDGFTGVIASNQGGVAGVAGGLIPIEAIDQFSMQSGGEADEGRNAGANQNMVIRSGTNHLHGDVFYFDRNELFSAISPVAPVGSPKGLLRNHQGGFTLGGPLWKNHTFLFLAGEFQIAKSYTAISDTVLSDAWMNAGQSLLGDYGFRPSQLSLNLYNLLYPANSKSGPATSGNYYAQSPTNYNSYNGIIKLDHTFSSRQTLSLRYLGTTGTQTAPEGSDYAEYFQTAPTHIHNFSLTEQWIPTAHIVNQLTLGTNYFMQEFNDADQGFYPQTNAGLNLGVSGNIAAGSPTIYVGAFDYVGATQPDGRVDVTGHITDSLHWDFGRHALKFGGEFRRTYADQMAYDGTRGTFTFDGSRGPWFAADGGGSTSNSQAIAYCATLGFTADDCDNLGYIADFLSGTPSNAAGATIVEGNPERVYLQNSEELWANDNFQVTPRLDLNFGVRYTIPGVVHAESDDIYSFVPGPNPGFRHGLYNSYYASVAPRVGFSYSPLTNNSAVIHGSFGIFYDTPGMYSYIAGTPINGGALYAQNNPAGPDPSASYVASNVQWQLNVNPFTAAQAPQVGAFGVDPNIRAPYAEVFSLNVERQLTRATLLTAGYVGTQGRRLLVLLDKNQPMASGSSAYNPAPYSQTTAYPNENPAFVHGQPLLGINQVNSAAESNYNSLQVTLRQASWHGLQATVNYTLSHSFDDASTVATPMNSYNLRQDYGPSTFDSRNNFNGYAFYDVPQLFHALPRVSKGWQLNGLFDYYSGLRLNPTVAGDNSHTTELKDRPDVTPGIKAYSGIRLASSSAAGREYTYLSNAPFSVAPVGTYGNEGRNAYAGPNFRDVDFSIFKHTPVTEHVMSEFRVEVFNIFNLSNFANPNVKNIKSAAFGKITNTRNGALAPGIGYGEPFNVQFALKLKF